MKNSLIYLLALSVLLFSSCEKDEDQVIVNGANNNPIVLELESNVVMDENYPDNPAMTLNWSYVDYGASVVPNYKVHFSTDAAFTAPYEALVTNWRTFTWTIGQLNQILQGEMMVPPNEESILYVKILASLGTNDVYEVESNVLEIPITPYATYTFTDRYLVGEATAPGWNPDNNNPALVRNPENEDEYFYTGYFNSGGFKILEILGLWQPQWGSNDGGSTLALNPGGGSDPDVLNVPSAGYYTYTFNFSDLSISVEPFDATSSSVYGAMGIIGSATPNGWDSDQDMTQSTFDPHVWYIESIDLIGGEAKFRADDDWANNWGSDTTYSGSGTPNGPNIPVISGTYKIWFYDLTGQYMFIPLNP